MEAAIKGARLHQYNRMFHDGGLHQADAPSQYPYPYKIISRYKSWHGATSGAASVSGDPRRWFQEPLTVPGVVFAPEANAYRPPFGSGDSMVDENLRYLEYIIENEGGSNKVAAVLVEPVVGSNGIIPHHRAIWKAFADFAINGVCPDDRRRNHDWHGADRATFCHRTFRC